MALLFPLGNAGVSTRRWAFIVASVCSFAPGFAGKLLDGGDQTMLRLGKAKFLR
jgi:hypothetical protein